MSTPFTTTLTVQTPLAAGQPPLPIVAALSAAYDSRTEYRLSFTVSGTKTLDMGTLGPNGAKLLLVTMDASVDPTVQPVLLSLNGATPGIEVSPGGFFALGSPQPTTAGVLSITITHASTAAMSVWVFG